MAATNPAFNRHEWELERARFHAFHNSQNFYNDAVGVCCTAASVFTIGLWLTGFGIKKPRSLASRICEVGFYVSVIATLCFLVAKVVTAFFFFASVRKV